MHTGRNSSSNLALSTQSCPLKLGKNFPAAHKFPNFVSGHTGSFGCTTSRKADNPKCVTLTSIHFAPCQVRFNINQSQYIIKAKLKVSSKFGKKQICMKLKATLKHLREDLGGKSSELFEHSFCPEPKPWAQSSLISPSAPSSSSLLLQVWLQLLLCANAAHSSPDLTPSYGRKVLVKMELHLSRMGFIPLRLFPTVVLPPAAASQSVWTFIPSPNPNKDTQSTKCYPRHSQSIKMVSSGQLLTLQEKQTQNSGRCLEGERTAQTHPKGFLFLF